MGISETSFIFNVIVNTFSIHTKQAVIYIEEQNTHTFFCIIKIVKVFEIPEFPEHTKKTDLCVLFSILNLIAVFSHSEVYFKDMILGKSISNNLYGLSIM